MDMSAKQSIHASANFGLLCVFVESTTWRIGNLSDHAKLVSRVTIGCSPHLAMVLIIATCAVELCCSSASLLLKDNRPAALLLLPAQLMAYGLFKTRSLPVVLALALTCMQTTELLGRKEQGLDDDGCLVRVERHVRGIVTRANVAAPMVVLVVLELIGGVWRVGADGYAAAINHDRSAFSLALMTLALRVASFDESPCSWIMQARDRVAPVVVPAVARVQADVGRLAQRVRSGTVSRCGFKKL